MVSSLHWNQISGLRMFAKDKACAPDHVNLQIKASESMPAGGSSGERRAGLHPGSGQ